MKDKEKQIEEMAMAKIICNAINNKELKHCDIQCNVDCLGIAKELLKHYQPKLPKDSVVLSREEFKLLTDIKDLQQQVQDSLSSMSEDIERIEKQASKETAEKCKEDISQLLKEHFGLGFYRLSCRDIIDDYFEKQYGLKEDAIRRILGEDIEKDEK